MKIAFLTDGIYPSLIGGMQKHSFYLVKNLAIKKIYIDLYYFVPRGKKDIIDFSENELKYINPIKLNYPKIPNLPGQYLIQEYLYSKKIYKELRKRDKVDFVYSQGFTSWAFPKKSNFLIGLNLHGFEMFQMAKSKGENLKKRLLQIPAKQSYNKANYIFSFGAKFDKLLFDIGIPKEKQKQFFNGISKSWVQSKINTTKNEKTFLFVGRYETRKGIEILNKTIKRLISDNEKFKFIFVGPIPKEKQILHSQVIYKGSISSEDKIKQIYLESDVYVLPSFSEGMPTVILEAMASGLAIIATDVGAVKHMVDSKNGIIISPENEAELYNSIKSTILAAPQKIDLQKETSIQRVQDKFTWDKIATNYNVFFNKVVNDAKIHKK